MVSQERKKPWPTWAKAYLKDICISKANPTRLIHHEIMIEQDDQKSGRPRFFNVNTIYELDAISKDGGEQSGHQKNRYERRAPIIL